MTISWSADVQYNCDLTGQGKQFRYLTNNPQKTLKPQIAWSTDQLAPNQDKEAGGHKIDLGAQDIKSITVPAGTTVDSNGNVTVDVTLQYGVNPDQSPMTIPAKLQLHYMGYTTGNGASNVAYVFQVTGVVKDPTYSYTEKEGEAFNTCEQHILYNKGTGNQPVGRLGGLNGGGIGTSNVRTIGFPGGDSTKSFQISGDSNIDSALHTEPVNVFLDCFLAGTQIKMREGYKAVEDIQIGDEVQVFVNGNFVNREIIKVKKALVTACFADYFPVCIKKDAFADHVPSQDLYVTSEHCLYVHGSFIPSRMLVNGRSIVWDKMRSSYYIYHIETAEHSIIESNGLLSESYLDTRGESSVDSKKTWEHDAAARLMVTRDFVEPIYNELAVRAIELDFPNVQEKHSVTKDADFHIVMDNGTSVYPFAVNKNRYLFALPKNTEKVVLVSRSNRPYDTVGSFVDDRRYLGVLIGQISCLSNAGFQQIDVHLKDELLSGWNNIENLPYRWTNGQAVLPVYSPVDTNSVLAIEVVDTNTYFDDYETESKIAVSA